MNIQTIVARTEDEERELLRTFWHLYESLPPDTPLVGYCHRRYDLPMLIQRSRYLGVPAWSLPLRKYDNRHVVDLFDLLTFYGDAGADLMKRTLDNFCRRFGIVIADETTGKDVAAMIAAGDYAAVAAHCAADVEKTRQLAQRIEAIEGAALVLDIETASIDGASVYLDGIQAPPNYKDEAKIRVYIEEKTREATERAALDINLGRVVCLGYTLIGPDAQERAA